MLSQVVGQSSAVQALTHIVSGRYSSPMLLVGEEGVGRRFAVQQLTRELFCQADKLSSCTCYACKQVRDNVHVDSVHVQAPEGKEMGVDQIRSLIEESDGYPLTAPVKIFMIEGVDRMTVAASNALLKTLEEPPSKVRFFLLAENYSKVIPTIRSRCSRVPFYRLPETFILSKVQQFEKDPTKSKVYTRMSEGSVGRAIQYWGAGKIAFRDRVISLLSAAVNKDIPSVFSLISSVEKELDLTLKILDQLVHDLLMVRHDAPRMIHLDAQETIVGLRKSMSDQTWSKLSTGLHNLIDLDRRANINLPFHLSTLLVKSFVEV